MAPIVERAPDRRGDEHARQPRPLLRQRAAAGRDRDLRVARDRRGDAARCRPRCCHALKSAPGMPDDLRDVRRARVRAVRLRGRSRCACRRRRSRAGSTCSVGDRDVSLIELGPAHTGGDTIVHVPDSGTVFTGDLLFIDGTPIVWAEPRQLARGLRPHPRARAPTCWSPATARSPTPPACATCSAT